ncbi:hypothetical protein NliqN6_3882 [Naganishia liquefaciens]|uniref:Uncharacterized protein n=1 Tax=Naganishia liquefaciens TaxID=104408 RepID=A0A8H3TVI3_9TREE|nr:hypothetical protein NliqN6_3882 [Naganishia liquefaciens]
MARVVEQLNLETRIRQDRQLAWPPFEDQVAIPLPTANRIIEWMGSVCDDLKQDPYLAAMCQRFRATYPAAPALMLLHCEHADPSLRLLEAIRTAHPDRPVPHQAFADLPSITQEGDGIRGLHGIYLHYLWVRTVDGKVEHRTYIGKGIAKLGNLSTGIGHQNRAEEIGILRRWNDYFKEMKSKKKDYSQIRPHPRFMLLREQRTSPDHGGKVNIIVADGATILREHRVVLFASTALDTIMMAYGMRDGQVDAVRKLHQMPRNRSGQEWGTDDTTVKLAEAFWRLVETFCLIASGSKNQDMPNTRARYTGRDDPFTLTVPYKTGHRHYKVIRETIPLNEDLRPCNLQMPCLEIAAAKDTSSYHKQVDLILACDPRQEVLEVATRIPFASMDGLSLREYLGYTPTVTVPRAYLREFWNDCKQCPLRSDTLVSVRISNGRLRLVDMYRQDLISVANDWRKCHRLEYSGNEQGTDFSPLAIEPSPVSIDIPFDLGSPTVTHGNGSLCIEINSMDEFGLIHRNLSGLTIWLAREDGTIFKVLGRFPRNDDDDNNDHSEFLMSVEDAKAFRSIGCWLRVVCFHMRQSNLFNEADGPFWNRGLHLPEMNVNVAARYVSGRVRAVPMAEQPQYAGLDSVWRQLEQETTDKTELCLRAFRDAFLQITSTRQLEQGLASDIETSRNSRNLQLHQVSAVELDRFVYHGPNPAHEVLIIRLVPKKSASTANDLVARIQELARAEVARSVHFDVLCWSNVRWAGLALASEHGTTAKTSAAVTRCMDLSMLSFVGSGAAARLYGIFERAGTLSMVILALEFGASRDVDNSTPLARMTQVVFNDLMLEIVAHVQKHVYHENGLSELDDSHSTGSAYRCHYTCHEPYDAWEVSLASPQRTGSLKRPVTVWPSIVLVRYS